MKLIVANHGSYPRIGDKPEQQKLRQALASHEKKQSIPGVLEEVTRHVVKDVIDEQLRAGAEIVTDGLVRWEDPISHFAGRLSGGSLGKLRRYFDVDFYYRQPLLSRTLPRRRGPLVLEEFRLARRLGAGTVKAVLTGPFTLGVLSKGAADARRKAVMRAYAAALAEEVRALAAEGAAWVQIDEPALLRSPKNIPLAAELLRPLAENRGTSKLILAVYFGPAAPVYEKLCALPADALALDFTVDGNALTECILARGVPKPLGLGLVDGRTTRLEKLPDLLEQLERLRPALTAPENFLMPSCGLEFLPRDKAFQKLVRLKEARDHFQARVATLGSRW